MKRRGFEAKLERLLREAKPPGGTIGIVNVEHKEACAFLRNPRVACRCDPEVTLVWIGRGAVA